jgi:L-threonylcarbamoyladenylate synthase
MIIKEEDRDSVTKAVNVLNKGEVISFATDTVYGIACDASNEAAVKKIYALKKRDKRKPVAIFVKNISWANEIFNINDTSMRIAKKFMPGPITLILDKKENSNLVTSDLLSVEGNNLGVRIPNHKFCLELLESFSGILAVTSANISDMPCANNAQDVESYFKDGLSLIIDGGKSTDISSSVIKANDNGSIEFLRDGAVSREDILSIL